MFMNGCDSIQFDCKPKLKCFTCSILFVYFGFRKLNDMVFRLHAYDNNNNNNGKIGNIHQVCRLSLKIAIGSYVFVSD